MPKYHLSTSKTWAATIKDLDETFRKWGINRWSVEPTRQPKASERQAVTLRYWRNNGEVVLPMGKQWKAVDNLRVLYLAVEAMRMNELRGISDVVASAYAQLPVPKEANDPYAVLRVDPAWSLAEIEGVWKARLKSNHPDRGGSTEMTAKLNAAMEEIRRAKQL